MTFGYFGLIVGLLWASFGIVGKLILYFMSFRILFSSVPNFLEDPVFVDVYVESSKIGKIRDYFWTTRLSLYYFGQMCCQGNWIRCFFTT